MKLTFFEEKREGFPRNAVVFPKHALRFRHPRSNQWRSNGSIPEILNAIDVVAPVGKKRRMIDPFMVKIANVERIIAPMTIGMDDAVWQDFSLNNRH